MANRHISGHEFCVMPKCMNEPHPLIPQPLCARHARSVYLSVKDMLDSATTEQRARSARPPQFEPGMRNRTDQPGLVYFMQFGDLIKIGFTSNMSTRRKSLRPDAVLFTIPGTREDERALHARFGPYWERGEYFRREGALATFVEVGMTRHAKGEPVLDG